MITVHHLENSRSQRVLWLLEELGVPYEVKRYERTKEKLAPPELKAVHPLGKSPVITDDGRVVAETGAVVEYLLDRHGQGRLRPAPGTDGFERYRYWIHAAEGSWMTPLVLTIVFSQINKAAPMMAKPVAKMMSQGVHQRLIDPTLSGLMDLAEAELSKGPWFAGPEFTAADVMMSFPLEGLKARDALGGHPALAAFVGTVQARPAYRAALAKGGPYAYA